MAKHDTPAAPARARRPEDVPPEDKLRIVREAAALTGTELGAYLRREGVHDADVARWRQEVDAAALAALSGRRQRTSEQKRIRNLDKSRLLRATRRISPCGGDSGGPG